MKLVDVRTVTVRWPTPEPTTPSRRASWSKTEPRATAMSRHRDLQRSHPDAASALHGHHVWVRVEAEDGTWGLGRSAFGRPVESLVDDVFAPLLVGSDAFATELHDDIMWRASLRAGDAGHTTFARSAIDLALWDLKGKLLGLPVYALAGGPVRPDVECYVTGDDLEWSAELGFRSFKVSNPVHHDDGADGLRAAEEKISRARSVVGDDADLMFNPIMSFNVDYAVRLIERLRPYRLRWVEEPLQPWDTDGLRRLRERAPYQSIATGEDHHGRHAFKALLDARCVDVLQPDIEWCGGFTEALRVATMAEASGVELAPHVGANTPWGQHFAVAVTNAPIAEYWLGGDPGVPLTELDRIPGAAVPRSGRVTPRSAPGFGLEITDDMVGPID